MPAFNRVLVLCFSLVVLLVAEARAGAPADQLRAEIDRVVKVLGDPALKTNTEARRQELRRVSDQIFDWQEMARRSLGRHWQQRTPAERQEFVTLFGNLLENAYFNRLSSYSGEKIEFVGESIDGDIAVVRTRVKGRSQEIPVEYRLVRRGDRWLVYDVSIENISLVNNYRAQFDKIISTSSYAELVRKMRERDFETKDGKA